MSPRTLTRPSRSAVALSRVPPTRAPASAKVSRRMASAARWSPGTFGHGGAWGTQAWVDPVRGVAYVLMVQRSNFANSDASEARRVFQEAAAAALGPK